MAHHSEQVTLVVWTPMTTGTFYQSTQESKHGKKKCFLIDFRFWLCIWYDLAVIHKTKAQALELPSMTALERTETMQENLQFVQRQAEAIIGQSHPDEIRALVNEAVEVARARGNANIMLAAAKLLASLHKSGLDLTLSAIALEKKISSVAPDNMNVQITNLQSGQPLPSVKEAQSAINRYVDILGGQPGDSGNGFGLDARACDLDRKLLEDISGAEDDSGNGGTGRIGGESWESEGDTVQIERESEDPVPEDPAVLGPEEAGSDVDSEGEEAGSDDPDPSDIL